MKTKAYLLTVWFTVTFSATAQKLIPPSNLQLYAEQFDVYVSWSAPASEVDLLGYNIYQNSLLIGNTNETNFIIEDAPCSMPNYYITAVYTEGESEPSNTMEIFLSVCLMEFFSDDFDDHIPDQKLACQNAPGWTTWTGIPCNEMDPYVTDEVYFSHNNSLLIEDQNDIVHIIDNYTDGFYIIRFQIYITAGFLGYFNVLQEYAGSASSWGMQAYFDENGQGILDAGGANATSFSYEYNTWIQIEIQIDLDSDWAEFIFNGEEIYTWQWSLGAFGNNNLNQLGGVNFYAWQDSYFYIDDFVFGSPSLCIPGPATNLQANLTENNVQLKWTAPGGNCNLYGFNIYRNSSNIGYTEETSFNDIGILPGSYNYNIVAVYENLIAEPSNSVNIKIPFQKIFYDDFESYLPGYPLVDQNISDYSLWNNNPGTGDAVITSTSSYNGLNSIRIEENSNIVKPINNFTEGIYSLRFYTLIPEGFTGYFDLLQEFDGDNSQWGMQIFFDDNGEGFVQAGTASMLPFNYEYDEWTLNEVVIDLNNDWAEYYFNEQGLHGWIWSTGVYGTGNLNQLGGVHFMAWNSADNTLSKFYVDDLLIDDLSLMPELCPPTILGISINDDCILLDFEIEGTNCGTFIGINVYINGEFIGTFEDEYEICEIPPGYYSIYVTALYVEGESEPSNIINFEIENYLPPPVNLYATIPIPGPIGLIYWDIPQNIPSFCNLLGYNIYGAEFINGPFIKLNNALIPSTFFEDDLEWIQYWEDVFYYATAVYEQGTSIHSDTVQAIVLNEEENKFENHLILFPNPAKNTLNIHSSNSMIIFIRMWDVYGNLLEELQIPDQTKIQLSTSEYKPGIYVICTTTKDKNYFERILFQ